MLSPRDRQHDNRRQAVERVIEAIVKHPASDWQIDDMAKIAQFSKFHFTRLFARLTGLPPHQWLMRYRIELAKELLVRGNVKTITDLTHMLGYTSLGTFSSRFSETVGCPPTSYRRMAAYADELTERAGRRGQFYRDAERLNVSLNPRDLPEFGETIASLERQLIDIPSRAFVWGERHPQ